LLDDKYCDIIISIFVKIAIFYESFLEIKISLVVKLEKGKET